MFHVNHPQGKVTSSWGYAQIKRVVANWVVANWVVANWVVANWVVANWVVANWVVWSFMAYLTQLGC
jgi:hypothetical protein